MIRTKNERDAIALTDDSAEVAARYGQEMVDCVLEAMAAGHEEFTIPTKADDDGRLSWKTKVLALKDSKGFRAVRVASLADNAHCEIIGHKIEPVVDATNVHPGAPGSEAAFRKANR